MSKISAIEEKNAFLMVLLICAIGLCISLAALTTFDYPPAAWVTW
jgi:hypothetical protein